MTKTWNFLTAWYMQKEGLFEINNSNNKEVDVVVVVCSRVNWNMITVLGRLFGWFGMRGWKVKERTHIKIFSDIMVIRKKENKTNQLTLYNVVVAASWWNSMINLLTLYWVDYLKNLNPVSLSQFQTWSSIYKNDIYKKNLTYYGVILNGTTNNEPTLPSSSLIMINPVSCLDAHDRRMYVQEVHCIYIYRYIQTTLWRGKNDEELYNFNVGMCHGSYTCNNSFSV